MNSLGSDLDALLSLVFTVLDSGTVLLTCAHACCVDLGIDSDFGISLRTGHELGNFCQGLFTASLPGLLIYLRRGCILRLAWL